MYLGDDDWNNRMCRDVARCFQSLELDSSVALAGKQVLICMSPRSGSTYLSSLLTENGLGNATEHFRVAGDQLKNSVAELKAKSYGEYFCRLLDARSVNGVFSTSVDWPQFRHVYHFGAFHKYLKNAHFVWLRRRDVLAQAVSRHIGEQTGYGNSRQSHLRELVNEELYDFDKIRAHIDHVVEVNGAWEQFFTIEQLSPQVVLYEDLASDPTAVVSTIFDQLDLPPPEKIVTKTGLSKIGSSINQEMMNRYREDLQARRLAFKARIFDESR